MLSSSDVCHNSLPLAAGAMMAGNGRMMAGKLDDGAFSRHWFRWLLNIVDRVWYDGLQFGWALVCFVWCRANDSVNQNFIIYDMMVWHGSGSALVDIIRIISCNERGLCRFGPKYSVIVFSLHLPSPDLDDKAFGQNWFRWLLNIVHHV